MFNFSTLCGRTNSIIIFFVKVFLKSTDRVLMKSFIFYTFIFFWVAGLSYTGAYLHGNHFVEFKNQKMKDFNIETNQWGMIHILGQGCGCSEIIGEYLIKRGPIKNHQERVYIIGEHHELAQNLKKSGFQVKKIDEFENRIEGVPMLIVHNDKGKSLYSGAYTKGVVTPISKILDLNIFKSIKENKPTKDLLVAGCAVSKELQSKLDPLGLKY